MKAEQFQQVVQDIPHQPGIYKYFSEENELLYVGKAKDLRKRVSSYFTKTFTTYKTHELVNRIHRIEFTIVDSEQDAFLLENSLIKQFQPRFNINLKDDKTYPFIVIKNEDFPRVFLTRRHISDGSEYLGPYTSVHNVRELLNLIRQNIQLRTCSLNLSPQQIAKGKFKVCLEYHLGNCKGPCQGFQSAEDYQEDLARLRNMLKGNLGPVFRHFKQEMQQYAENLEFEKAEWMRKKIEHLESYQSRSVVVSRHLVNLDVFSILKDSETAYVNYLMVQNGTIVQTHTTLLETPLDEAEAELLSFAIVSLRQTFNSTAAEIVVPFPVEYPGTDLVFTIPKAGDKKKLLELSQKNVHYFAVELKKKKALNTGNTRSAEEQEALLEGLMEDLQLPDLPVHIECFDNSNFQGSFPVSAMVCFRNAVPSKKDYRKFNVKTVKGINDFATMKEVVFRRYRRLVEEKAPLPQLVIIDGGKGQLSAAMESVSELGLTGMMTVVGLAKNEEEIFFPGDQQSLRLPFNSESLKLIRRIRDEVHRFGITFHRRQRSKGTFKNELEQIKGIGPSVIDMLMKKFRSVKKIGEADTGEIEELIGKAKAGLIKKYFVEKGAKS